MAEGLAWRVACGDVPEELRSRRIVSLDMASMLAGTKYRGDFEDRVKCVLRDVERAGDVIIFIDEIHTIVGAGSAEGALDAANICLLYTSAPSPPWWAATPTSTRQMATLMLNTPA